MIFALEAPLAAFGDVAVGERRYGADRPAKSAVLGLIAAALGIERADEARHASLHDGLGYAVRIDLEGRPLEDFHTAQTPPAKRGKTWPTRRAELMEEGLETILSQRDYRTDAAFTIILWPRSEGHWTLEDLVGALKRPHFALYLGRKCCPLGRAPWPMLIDAPTLGEALLAFDREEAERFGDRTTGRRLHADPEAEAWLGADWRRDRLVQRRDALLSRQRWQFTLRSELVAVADMQGGSSP